jgi:hypothetical protein
MTALREGASGWDQSRVALTARPNQAMRDRPFPGPESPDRPGQQFDMGRREPGIERPEEHPELYRGIFYEPPYSLWEAAVGFIVIVFGRLLCLLLWQQ